MATLYGHGKGKARSHKPVDLKPKWIEIKGEDAEILVLELSKKGVGEAKIGLILRDSYGIPSIKALTGKSTRQIIKESTKEERVPYEIINLIKRLKVTRKHYEKNKQDKTAKRGIQLIEAKIRRLESYYKDKNILPKTWNFNEVKV